MSDLTARVGETTLTVADIYLLGELVLNLAATTPLMRHATPAGSLDYIGEPGREDHVSEHILRDFVLWSGKNDKDAAARLLVGLQRLGWLDHHLNAYQAAHSH